MVAGLYCNDASFPAVMTNQLPICVDIGLELLSDDDMQRYNQPGADKAAIEARNAKVYSTRVYFPNRVGYQAR